MGFFSGYKYTHKFLFRVADYCVQAIVCNFLKINYPQYPIIAEESSDYLRKSEGRETLESITNLYNETLNSRESSTKVIKLYQFLLDFRIYRLW